MTMRFDVTPLLLVAFAACSSSGGQGSGGASAATPASNTASSTAATSSTGGGGDAGSDASSYPPPYTIDAFKGVVIHSQSSEPNFQKASVDISFDKAPFASVHLVVDLTSPCYPFDKWKSDPPPSGQNWPADCDAFDRNFEFSLDDPATMSDPPGIELERAITPFGGPLHLDVDITDVANGLPGKHKLQVLIPTYSDSAGMVSGSDGSWTVDAEIEVTPGVPPHKVLSVVSLFDGQQTMEPAPAPIAFTTPKGTTSARLEWRATGHGGAKGDSECIGPAEEFCHRHQTLLLDGATLLPVNPWRTDCSKLCTLTHYGPVDAGFDYCLQDPCGDPNSVRASRANWCPGSETPPDVSTDAKLAAPGQHQFSWTVDKLATGGEWRLSATYFAFGD